MDKNNIKKYAVWARRELISRVSQKAMQYGISDTDIVSASAPSVNGVLLTSEEMAQRKALFAQIELKGYEQVMEEVAYTWFNRFIALRFMEVNGYLPSMVRVFSNDNNEFKPQILAEALNLNLEGLNMDKVFSLKEAGQNEELFKYLLIVQCNALNGCLPVMFQRIEDYTELLLPDNLLREGSVVEQLVSTIPEEDWTDQVQIIGWLYQYYNAQKKDDVFAALKKNVKITKENIPAATQLFTPDWIVRYMVENSLGRLWLEGHPDEVLKSEWRYYLDEAEQEPAVEAQLEVIRADYRNMDPTQIKVIDPCMGSGHILVYAFDVLMQIYQSTGWSQRDAARIIVQNNLYGLDIDDRAAQLAYFAVMMKGCQYDRRFLKRQLQPNVFAISESGRTDAKGNREWLVSDATIEYFADGNEMLYKDAITIRDAMFDAKEYGSILTMPKVDFDAMKNRIDELWDEFSMYRNEVIQTFWPVLRVAEFLARKYDVVVTNPPYMGASGMSVSLSDYVKKNFPDSKSDLFAVFIEHGNQMARKAGYNCMVTMQSWMFLSSFEKMRNKLLHSSTIINLMHMDNMVMRIAFGTAVTVFRNIAIERFRGTYNHIKLEDIEQDIPREFPVPGNRFTQISTANFSKIPGMPVAYWASAHLLDSFSIQPVGDVVVPRHGLATSDNNRFLKLWHEVCLDKTSLLSKCDYSKKWFPMNKGGAFRKWYGNLDWVINYENDGQEIKAFAVELYKSASRTIQNTQFYFLEGITWSALTSGALSFRWTDVGAIFGSGAHCAFATDINDLLYGLALLNGKVSSLYLSIMSPTLNTNVDDIRATPLIVKEKDEVVSLVQECIDTSKSDWDAFETSWDFKEHPLIRIGCVLWDATAVGAAMHYYYGEHPKISCPLELCFMLWQGECNERFKKLKENEEELNRIFIDIYGLQEELTPEVDDKDVSVRLADIKRDIKSLISYAVGCMFGRYSLDVPGLAYAGGEWNPDKYAIFIPTKSNIIPICDDDYFDDDITARFVDWIKTVYGVDTLEENLKFIADALGGKGNPRDIIRKYFLNEFYADHLKVYQKRPIYWLFDSGKKNGFKALIYMHRYEPDTIARIRTDYVHELQSRYRTSIENLEKRITTGSTSERAQLGKRLKSLQEQAAEIFIYEEKIHHLADQMISIDLDDGVKKNYEIFKDVLAKVK